MPKPSDRPYCCTPEQLSKVAVLMLEPPSLKLQCCRCDDVWTVSLLVKRIGAQHPKVGLPLAYWRCPRCNPPKP
jgi:hypothetical protein